MTTSLRPYLPADAPILAILMQASVEELAVDDYTEDQRAAWLAETEDEAAWAKKLASNLTLVALDDDNEPVAFAVLMQNKAIAHVHVHPDLIGMGLGRTLCEACIKLALARGGDMLMVDSSDNAKGFFEKLGFEAKARNTINYGEEWLGMTTMEKPLKAPASVTVQ
jgi:putative acetyltransferase